MPRVQTRVVTGHPGQDGKHLYDLPDGFVWAKLEWLLLFGPGLSCRMIDGKSYPGESHYRVTHVFPTEAALWAAIPKPPRGYNLRQVVNGAFLPMQTGPSKAEVGKCLRKLEAVSQ
jgi:hypothetical protein